LRGFVGTDHDERDQSKMIRLQQTELIKYPIPIL